jgi:hypothetical protein
MEFEHSSKHVTFLTHVTAISAFYFVNDSHREECKCISQIRRDGLAGKHFFPEEPGVGGLT